MFYPQIYVPIYKHSQILEKGIFEPLDDSYI